MLITAGSLIAAALALELAHAGYVKFILRHRSGRIRRHRSRSQNTSITANNLWAGHIALLTGDPGKWKMICRN